MIWLKLLTIKVCEMTKSQLILRLAARYRHLVQQDAEIAVNLIVKAMIDALAQGRRIEMREFGSFTLREHKARKARNPRTGAAVYVPEKARIYFRATGELKRRVKAALLEELKKENHQSTAAKKTTTQKPSNQFISSQEMMRLTETSN